MRSVLKTIVPRVRNHIRDRGLMTSLRRGYLLPIYLLREFVEAKRLRKGPELHKFDLAHGVETSGHYGPWIYLRDLKIPSPNWYEGNNYIAIDPDRFRTVLKSLDIAYEQYTFIDYGSGKGRALLVASEFPFKKVLGLEFAPELHRVAEENIRAFRSERRKCAEIRSINIDFSRFELPIEPLVLYFYDPCRGRVLSEVVRRIRESIQKTPRPFRIVIVAPRKEWEDTIAAAGFTAEVGRDDQVHYIVYANADPIPETRSEVSLESVSGGSSRSTNQSAA